MHPNNAFRPENQNGNADFARACGFGTLALNAQDGPLLAHIPFLLSDDGTQATLHLVRSNPILRMLETPQPAVIAVTGPNGYISPDWYGVDDQVPTWNYVAVHLRGTLETLPQTQIREVIDSLSAQFEDRLSPKPSWTSAKMTPDVLDRMMRMIVPLRLNVARIDGTWKLNQNKPEEVRLRAADAVENGNLAYLAADLAGLMRQPPK